MSRYSPLELAEAFIRTGELSDALDALNAHIEADPTDEAALRLRSAVLMRLPGEANARAALDDLQRVTTPTAEDFVQQSIIWQMGLDNWEQALMMTEQAYARAAQDERIAERLLMLYEHQGEYHRARDLCAEQPRNWRWLQLAGDLAQRTEDYAAAIEWYTEALDDLTHKLDTVDNPIARNIMGMICGSRATVLLKAGRLPDAQTDFETTAEIFKTDLSYSLMVGVTLALQGRIDEAGALCGSILEDEPAFAAVLREQAVIYPKLEALLEQLGINEG